MVKSFAFVDLLVSEITMISAVILFFFCLCLLLFKRKTVSARALILAGIGLAVTAVYLGFILFMVVMWG